MHTLICRSLASLTILIVVCLPTTGLAAEPTSSPSLAADAFIKTVSALPAEQQVGAVIAKLKELNPNFDGKETHKIENGVVTELAFSSVGVTDISPIPALTWLKKLTLAPWTATQKGSLSDLSALKGMKLTWLWCHNNPISDLAPLQGMPLTVLSCGGTQAGNLTPLTGMKLTVLSCNDTTVSDLAPLEGMPLIVFWCNNTQATDLGPLKAMPLREIKCDFVAERDASVLRGIRTLAKINDLPTATFWARVGPIATTATPSKVAGATKTATTKPETATLPTGTVSAKEQLRRFVEKMKELNPGFDGEIQHKLERGKLVEIAFSSREIKDLTPMRDLKALGSLVYTTQRGSVSLLTDISPLAGLPLTSLVCYYTKISDLSPLRGMRLVTLDVRASSVADLSPLQGMPLARLTLIGTPIKDIAALKGMRLTHLSVEGTKVSDLSPLKGMGLEVLYCLHSKVSDLAPLKGSALRMLVCQDTNIADFSPLRGCPLHEIALDFVPERDSQILRSFKTLERINNLPATEFWKRVKAGDVPQAK